MIKETCLFDARDLRFLLLRWIVRLRADSTASTQKRCVDQIVEYALTVKKQTVMRVGNIYPSIKEYLLIRNRTGGVKVINTEFAMILDSKFFS